MTKEELENLKKEFIEQAMKDYEKISTRDLGFRVLKAIAIVSVIVCTLYTGGVFLLMKYWKSPVMAGQGVWLYAECKEFTMAKVPDEKDPKKEQQIRQCTRYGTTHIYKVGTGPTEIPQGAFVMGAKVAQ